MSVPSKVPRAVLIVWVTAMMTMAMVEPVRAGRAASTKPADLPDDFCPKATGAATATTGECMCDWQHRDGCVGSACQYEMGLTWYHYSCKDCRCVAEPK